MTSKWESTEGLDRQQLIARIESMQQTVDGLEEALAEARSIDPELWYQRIKDAADIVRKATGDEDPDPVFAELAAYIRRVEKLRDSLQKDSKP